jgi:hypothetical protein
MDARGTVFIRETQADKGELRLAYHRLQHLCDTQGPTSRFTG